MIFFEDVPFFLHLFDFILEDFDVQFELLLHFDVVANFEFILLELLLVFFGRQVQRLKGGGERGEANRMVSLELLIQKDAGGSVTRLFFKFLALWAVLSNFFLFKFHLHKDFYRSSDVVQDRQTVKFQKSITFFAELILVEIINL